jgi:hypothetical protein
MARQANIHWQRTKLIHDIAQYKNQGKLWKDIRHKVRTSRLALSTFLDGREIQQARLADGRFSLLALQYIEA